MVEPLVSVVIVTHNRREELNRALISVYSQSYTSIEIIILDNNSTDDTFKFITSNYPDVKLIHSEINLGCPGGRNKAVDYSNGEIIFFLDDDAWIDEITCVSNVVKKFGNNNSIAVIMTNILEHSGKLKYLRYSHETDIYLPTFSGGVSFILRKIFNEFGRFPKMKYGSEEKFLAVKLFEKEYKILLAHDLIIHHKPSIQRNKCELMYLRAKNDIFWLKSISPIFVFLFIAIWKTMLWSRLSFIKKCGLSGLVGSIHGIKSKNILETSYKMNLFNLFKYFIFRKRFSIRYH